MPTKTDRILSYLPGTFRIRPAPEVLYPLVSAFGDQLQQASNSLSEVMQAHWVDYADRGAELIDDLARMAALYGLAPRGSTPGAFGGPSDETVEEFRTHLKRYIRTFLDGTVTVQGVLRIVAEALNLDIHDDWKHLRTWWRPGAERVVTWVTDPADAGLILFGRTWAVAEGTAARPARVVGTVDLGQPVDLSGGSLLRVQVDGGAVLTIDVAANSQNHAAVTADEILAAVRGAAGGPVAALEAGRLVLASHTAGAESALAVNEGSQDAAPALLGLLPAAFTGSDATHGVLTGRVDLSGTLALGDARYLRIVVDGAQTGEADLGSATTLDQVVAAINAALGGSTIASAAGGKYLVLTSPTTGPTSSIALALPAAQDARARVLGDVPSYAGGLAAQPAVALGTADLAAGADLSHGSQIRVQIDGRRAVTVNVAGQDPAHTLLSEMVAALNQTLGGSPASHDGHHLRLASSSTGRGSSLQFQPLAPGTDATAVVFGIAPRTYQGTDALGARLTGEVDLSRGADVIAGHLLRLSIDGAAPVDVDLLAGSSDPGTRTLDQIVAAINQGLGQPLASGPNGHLAITSPTTGKGSRVALAPVARAVSRRFVTQALFAGEAAEKLLGAPALAAQGVGATSAVVVGTVDLSRTVDLRAAHTLRIAVDGAAPRDIDCAAGSPRPRVAALKDIVAAINNQLGQAVASSDGQHLILRSSSAGAASEIRFEAPQASDALDVLLGTGPVSATGGGATNVTFVGIPDLGNGVDLSAASHLSIGVDGAAAVDVDCAGADPAHTSLTEILIKINSALNATIARASGGHLALLSQQTGQASQISIGTPASGDATLALLGVSARAYHGADAARAVITGQRDLPATLDLSVARSLCVAVGGGQPTTIDTASQAADPHQVTPAQVVAAINASVQGVASLAGSRLVLSSPQPGAASQVAVSTCSGGDARTLLLGNVPDDTVGRDGQAAQLASPAPLTSPVDLSAQSILRIAIDGQSAIDIDVAGAAPANTFADEVAAAVNAALPGVAAVVNDGLQLTSPTVGADSRIEVLPVRLLEVVEFPPAAKQSDFDVRHAVSFNIDNDGAAADSLSFDLLAPQGVPGPELVNHTSGRRLRLAVVLDAGDCVHVWAEPGVGILGTVTRADGTTWNVPAGQILVGRPGAQVWVPFDGQWQLSGGYATDVARLELNNPLAPAVLALSARVPGPGGDTIWITAKAAQLAAANPPDAADGAQVRLTGRLASGPAGGPRWILQDGQGQTLAGLRAGPGVHLAGFEGLPVVAHGVMYEVPPAGDGAPARIALVTRIAALFDVTLGGPNPDGGAAITETYPGVSIGGDWHDADDLAYAIATGPSALVGAATLAKADALLLPAGRSVWGYFDCSGARYDACFFDGATFASGLCAEAAVFDATHFSGAAHELEQSVYAGDGTEPTAKLSIHWTRYSPGSFAVNLPADLPEQYGGRFDQMRLARDGGAAEEYLNVVSEPESDPDYFVQRLAHSELVDVTAVDLVPIGFTAWSIPIRHPRVVKLTGGTASSPAQLYLQDPEAGGRTIRLAAKEPGTYGNAIAVTVRKSGPGLFDVTVSFDGATLESARAIALTGDASSTGYDPGPGAGPVGVLQARAAGIDAHVTRDRT